MFQFSLLRCAAEVKVELGVRLDGDKVLNINFRGERCCVDDEIIVARAERKGTCVTQITKPRDDF